MKLLQNQYISKTKIYMLILGLLSVMLGGHIAFGSPLVDAARDTSYDCERYVHYGGSTSVPGVGTYHVVQYGLKGNDAARWQNNDNGAIIADSDPSPSNYTIDTGPNFGDCAAAFGYSPIDCDPNNGINLFWDCLGNVPFTNSYYRTFFGGSPTKVYLGSAIAHPDNVEHYENNPALVDSDYSDPTRTNAGVTSTLHYPFGDINDAGLVNINNQRIWCVGFGIFCRLNALTDGAGGNPAAWAGYLDAAQFISNPTVSQNAIENIPNVSYRDALFKGSGVPVRDLHDVGLLASGATSFQLRMSGANTQDPFFGCLASTGVSWDNGPAPNNCYSGHFLNTKVATYLTFFVPETANNPFDPKCDNIYPSPSSPEPGQLFNITATFKDIQNMHNNDINYQARITIDGTSINDRLFANGKLSKTSSALSVSSNDPNWLSIPTAGQYTGKVTLGLTGQENRTITCPFGGSNEPPKIPITAKPYVRVYGNDTIAGGNFANTNGICSGPDPNPDASIATFAVNESGWKGSGVEYAAFAMGAIMDNGFISASTHNGAATGPKLGLTFGNYRMGNAMVNDFGGLSGISSCAPNYYSLKSANARKSQADNISTLISASNEALDVNPSSGKTMINGSWSNISGNHAVFINGDLIINDDISLASFSDTDVNGIPSLYVVVKGNIYLTNKVKRLDGVFIAQPDGSSGGTIFTCAKQNATTYTISELYDNCGNQLIVNGAFIANKVRFLRTNGTLNAAGVDEAPSSNKIAEVFNFTPSIYLAKNPYIVIPDTKGQNSTIISLPPIL